MEVDESKIFGIERPAPPLMQYYLLCSFLAGPFFPIALIPLFFKYHTLRYRFDKEGVSMRWGILFRREIILNYSRIQDIHLTSNIVERWLGLARVQIQTASGSASAEMTVEGLREFEAIRDFLYSKMRGLKGQLQKGGASVASSESQSDYGVAKGQSNADIAIALHEAANELRALRKLIEEKSAEKKVPSDVQ